MKKSEKIIDHIDVDAVWKNPKTTWRFWAEKIGAHYVSVTAAMKREGWVRDSQGNLKEAPCKNCDNSLEIEKLNGDRLCRVCSLNPNREQYERELKKYLQRNPNMASGVHRHLEGVPTRHSKY